MSTSGYLGLVICYHDSSKGSWLTIGAIFAGGSVPQKRHKHQDVHENCLIDFTDRVLEDFYFFMLNSERTRSEIRDIKVVREIKDMFVFIECGWPTDWSIDNFEEHHLIREFSLLKKVKDVWQTPFPHFHAAVNNSAKHEDWKQQIELGYNLSRRPVWKNQEHISCISSN